MAKEELNKEALLKKNPNVNKDVLEDNRKALSEIQRLGIKKEYGLALPTRRKRVQAIDIKLQNLTIQLRYK